MTRGQTHIIEIWGDFACFSRPEFKVERWSYPCPTPSAARGIFDAIYCKGWDHQTGDAQFYWQVEKIELLAEPAYIALRRNEVGSVISIANAKEWMNGTNTPKPLMADDANQRQQRQTMAIRSPRYRIHARIIPRPKFATQQLSFEQQFLRRARAGKCFQQPYLGCREFVAFYRYIESLEGESKPVDYTQDLGLVLYDVFDLRKVNDFTAKTFISVFKARVEHGVLHVPPYESEEVLKPDSERRAG